MGVRLLLWLRGTAAKPDTDQAENLAYAVHPGYRAERYEKPSPHFPREHNLGKGCANALLCSLLADQA